MSENANLTYNDFSAGYTAGDCMTILDDNTILDEIRNWVFDAKSLWYYDGAKYRIVIQFEDQENTAIVYFFNDNGEICSKSYGGDM